jgi:hypothetical protein
MTTKYVVGIIVNFLICYVGSILCTVLIVYFLLKGNDNSIGLFFYILIIGFPVILPYIPFMFLAALYKKWKLMFWAVIMFIIAQAFFMFKAVETVPFFLFNMYSTKQKNFDTSYYNTVYVNGQIFPLDHLSGREREILLGSLAYYRKLKTRRFLATDSATIAGRFLNKLPPGWYNLAYERLTNKTVTDSIFLNWWTRYLSKISGQKPDSFTIIQSRIAWKPHFHHLHDTVSLITYVNRSR